MCSDSVGADGVVSNIRVVAERGGNLSSPNNHYIGPRAVGDPMISPFASGSWLLPIMVGSSSDINAKNYLGLLVPPCWVSCITTLVPHDVFIS